MIIIKFAVEGMGGMDPAVRPRDQLGGLWLSCRNGDGLEQEALMERPQLLIAPTADFAALLRTEQRLNRVRMERWPQTSCCQSAR